MIGWLLACALDGPPEEPSARIEAAEARAAAAEARADAAEARLNAAQEHLMALERTGTSAARLPGPGAARDRVAFGRPLVVDAQETVRDAVAIGGPLTIHGQVLGDATALGGGVSIGPGGSVHGHATALGGAVSVDPHGELWGDPLALGEAPWAPATERVNAWIAGWIKRIAATLAFAGGGVITVGLFPDRVARIGQAVTERPLTSALLGTVGTGAWVLGCLLLTVFTLGLGLPIAALLLALLGLAGLLGLIGIAQVLGDLVPIHHRSDSRWVTILLGVGVLAAAGALPTVGGPLLVGATLFGVGAAVTSRFGAAR